MANLEEPYLTLKWETGAHLGILLAKFHSLFQQGKFLDVTLSADGQFLKAHSLILCASSQFFEVGLINILIFLTKALFYIFLFIRTSLHLRKNMTHYR